MTRDFRLFDLHCDTLTEAEKRGLGLVNRELMLSLDALPDAAGWCQCFAIFIPDSLRGPAAADYYRRVVRFWHSQLAAHAGRLVQLHNAAEPAALPCGRVGGLLTVEGGAVLGGRLDLIEELRRDGVRALTLTWNGANELGSGCETEEGLTPFGRRAVAALEQAGIAVDVSHLNDAGFRDLCAAAKRPFLATHSNARSICPVPRNLADWQICEIRDRGGIIGLNFIESFLAGPGQAPDFEAARRHLEHFLSLGCERCLAIGTDYDGGAVSPQFDRPAKLEDFYQYLLGCGFDEAFCRGLFFENARRFFAALPLGGAAGSETISATR